VKPGWIWTERLAWAVGIVAVSSVAVLYVIGTVSARQDLDRFADRQAADVRLALASSSMPDERLWCPERIAAWVDRQHRAGPPPLAVLRIPRIGLEVAVLEGTDEWTLNRAVGLIEDTAAPGVGGNTGIAGHRDGFFRGLKDIRTGDVLELETPSGMERYGVERTLIVEQDDVWVLGRFTAFRRPRRC
jgi:sortase A